MTLGAKHRELMRHAVVQLKPHVEEHMRKAGAALTATREELKAAWGDLRLPAELLEMWGHCRAARLFEDVDHGQWGLEILSPSKSAERTARERRDRPADFRFGDTVIGEFLGDQELVVLADDGSDPTVLVALPLDPRTDWHRAASSLVEFLDRYNRAGGEKFWE